MAEYVDLDIGLITGRALRVDPVDVSVPHGNHSRARAN